MYRLKESVMSSRIDDESILLDTVSGKYFGINASGTKMLEAILETGDLEAALARLGPAYDIGISVIRKDLLAFIGSLEERGLLEVD